MKTDDISAANPYPYRRLQVLDSEMAYVEAGEGEPIVFLHGNPTTSYLWRNVIPHVEGQGRCLAPDLIGAGESGKMPSGAYRFAEHVKYVDAWFEALGLTKNVILVIHDWGAALGFYRTCRYPDHISGIAYMEAMVRPRLWSDMPEERVAVFKKLRSPEGDRMVMESNFFVETMLFDKGIIRDLTEEEKAVYRAPTEDPEKRMLTLQWAREIPFEGAPADNYEMVKRYSDFLSNSEDLPKLFINCEFGHALAGAAREFCRKWPNQTEITLPARHYVQEDCPHEVGRAVSAFVKRVRG
ncbi:MAG: haloalkane dehalogenase [Nitrospinota bacterium]